MPNNDGLVVALLLCATIVCALCPVVSKAMVDRYLGHEEIQIWCCSLMDR